VSAGDWVAFSVIVGALVLALFGCLLHCAYAAGWNAAMHDRSQRDPMDPTFTVYR
jgi:hypothetical protein